MYLGDILENFAIDNIKQSGYMYCFLVDYESTDAANILGIQKYSMKEE